MHKKFARVVLIHICKKVNYYDIKLKVLCCSMTPDLKFDIMHDLTILCSLLANHQHTSNHK